MVNIAEPKNDLKTVLVTGATGFLGSHLTRSLLQNNYRVIVLKRSFSNLQRLQSILPQLITYNLDQIELSQPFQDFPLITAIIHTATCYGFKQEGISTILESNTLFPLRLLEKAIQHNIPYFLNTDTFFSKEEYTASHRQEYSLSKKQFLDWGKILANQQKIKFINLRVEHLFGGQDNPKKFINFLIRTCLTNTPRLPLTLGEQQRDFIHVEDTVLAYLMILQNFSELDPYYYEYEIGTGQAIALRELVEKVHILSQSETQLEFGMLPYREGDIMYSQANIKPLKQLGWQPQANLESRLRQTIEAEKERIQNPHD